MLLTFSLWYYLCFPEMSCLSHLHHNITGPTQRHRAGLSIRPRSLICPQRAERVLGQRPVTVRRVPQAPLIRFSCTKAFLSYAGQTTSVWLALPQQKNWKDSQGIANHCDCLTNNITEENIRIASYQAFVFFPLYFFPFGLSPVTKNTQHNSAALQEHVAPKLSSCAWIMLSKAGASTKLLPCFVPYHMQL